MECAWQSYINLLPLWMRTEVDMLGRNTLEELRLRIHSTPELVTTAGSRFLKKIVSVDDIRYCINAASRYSPWAATTIAQGFITAPGGHRIGICGDVMINNKHMSGIGSVSSICIRVARSFVGIGNPISNLDGSILIIGKPGSGKTTLLRDLIRSASDQNRGSVCVVDEKRELFPCVQDTFVFPVGKHTDVLSGVNKREGITVLLRNMNPRIIAVDEITAEDDSFALVHAGWCGVRLYATAHASSIDDLKNRPVYKPIISMKLFDFIVVLMPDRSFQIERMI